jgi:hypothetical protein
VPAGHTAARREPGRNPTGPCIRAREIVELACERRTQAAAGRHAAIGGLPTREVVTGDEPHPPVELARLDQVQTGAQLVGILGAAPPTDLVEEVFARSERNPFFTRSCWRSYGPAPASCRRPCAICSAAGFRRCPNRPSTCSRWSQWRTAGAAPAGGRGRRPGRSTA